MRYLKSRNEFLYKEVTIDKSTINEQIKSSKMISEAFENDIRWGDSLVGRLINSAIRTVKIGYNETKIPKILEELQGQLDQIVSESLTRETGAKFNQYYIMVALEEMKDICLSPMSDEEKLDKLIGWDGSTPMWDPNDPRADIPGLIENRRPITKSIMQNIIDKITTKLPDLEKYVGKNRDEFIDDLCDFTEELRKLTIKTPVGGNSAQIRPFSARMNSILTRLQSVNESLRLSRYYNFINEDNETTSNIKQLKDLASELSKEIGGKEENEIKGLDNFKKFKGVFFKLNDNEKEKLKVEVDDEEKDLYDLLVDLLGEGGESGKTSNIEQISWNKVVQSFTKSGVSSLIPTIKSTLEDLNSNDEKKKMRSIEIINGVAKQISINITTIGKDRLSYEQLIKEDGYNKTENVEVINNISKSISLLSNVIMAYKGQDILNSQGPKSGFIKSFIQNYEAITLKKNESVNINEEKTTARAGKYIKNQKDQKNQNQKSGEPNVDPKNNQNQNQKSGEPNVDPKNNQNQNTNVDPKNNQNQNTNVDPKNNQNQNTNVDPKNNQNQNNSGEPKSDNTKKGSSQVSVNTINILKSILVLNDLISKKESWILLENNFNPGGGTGSTNPTGTGSSPSDDDNKDNNTERTVKNLWNTMWKPHEDEMMSKGEGSHRLTQRMVDDLQSMIDKGEDKKVLDLSKRPDPLIAIVRVCRKAHNTYFTDLIPSGRKDGMVSNKTFREYIFLGGSNTRPDPNRLNGEGPWAVKSIWEKWTDGVTKILEDQQYRKILSNVEFIVPGAEDVFNPKKNESKIYEAETGNRLDAGELTKGSKHGTIILDFLSEMIDKESVRDFEGSRKKLMKKYFGIVTGPSEDPREVKRHEFPGASDQKNSIRWWPFTKQKFSDTDKHKLFLFPVKDKRDKANDEHTSIFLQVLDITNFDGKSFAVIKFTYDRQIMAKRWRELKDRTKKLDYHDWSTKDSSRDSNLYYGIMQNKWDTDKISIVYGNITNKGTPVVNIWAEPQSGHKYNFILDPNTPKSLPNSTYESKKAIVKISKLQKFDPNGVGSDISEKNLICFREENDDQLPLIKFHNQSGPTRDNLIDKFYQQGKTWGYW